MSVQIEAVIVPFKKNTPEEPIYVIDYPNYLNHLMMSLLNRNSASRVDKLIVLYGNGLFIEIDQDDYLGKCIDARNAIEKHYSR